jgi:hypothetical protein
MWKSENASCGVLTLNKLKLAPFTFGSTSTVVSYFNCGPPDCATVTAVANPLFGTAINGLSGCVLEPQARLSF